MNALAEGPELSSVAEDRERPLRSFGKSNAVFAEQHLPVPLQPCNPRGEEASGQLAFEGLR